MVPHHGLFQTFKLPGRDPTCPVTSPAAAPPIGPLRDSLAPAKASVERGKSIEARMCDPAV